MKKMQRAGLDTGCLVTLCVVAHPPVAESAIRKRRVSFHAAAALIILLSVGCAHPLRTATRASVACSMTAHFVDLSTTMFAVGKGVGTELNPVLAPFAAQPVAMGFYKGGLSVAGNYPLLKYQADHPKLTLALGLAQCVGFSAIGAHNASVIRKAQ